MLVGITIPDIFISLFYVILIMFLARMFKERDKSKSYTKYYLPFFFSKVIYALLFVLIHSYYYRGGDTFLYFTGANFFRDQLIANPTNAVNLFFSSFEELKNIVYNQNLQVVYFFGAKDVYLMSKLVGILSFFCFGKFLATSILFTCLTAIGLWKLYQTLCELYPRLYKYFAIGILFYPSLSIWGSGILKDPLTLCCVGLIFNAVYNLIKRKRIISSMVLIIISIFLCQVLKPYILYTFVPIILLWVQGNISKQVKSSFLKVLIVPIILVAFVAGGAFFLRSLSASAGKYSIENVQSVAKGFNEWHTFLSETRNQSGYSFGEVEFTPLGVLSKAPQAFFVTYYRPFIIGDVKNIPTAFEGIQVFILLLITIYAFLKVGLMKTLIIIVTDNNVRSFILFSVVFGIAVGITSYNFGALSRYKIPSLPFFTASLAIIYYKGYLIKNKHFK